MKSRIRIEVDRPGDKVVRYLPYRDVETDVFIIVREDGEKPYSGNVNFKRTGENRCLLFVRDVTREDGEIELEAVGMDYKVTHLPGERIKVEITIESHEEYCRKADIAAEMYAEEHAGSGDWE